MEKQHKATSKTNEGFKFQNIFMLMTLNMRVWTAKKTDPKMRQKLVDEFGADSDVVNATKVLFSSNEFDQLKNFAQATRVKFNEMTAPWDRATRIFHNSRYGEIKDFLEDAEKEFDRLAQIVIQQINPLTSQMQASASKLAGLYAEEDYPSGPALQRKFKFEWAPGYVTTGSDFRVDIANDHAQKIIEKMNRVADERVREATMDTAQRVCKAVKQLAEALRKGKGYHYTNFKGLAELITIARSLNVSNNAQLNEKITKIEELLLAGSPKDLTDKEVAKDFTKIVREDKELEKKFLEQADSLTDELDQVTRELEAQDALEF